MRYVGTILFPDVVWVSNSKILILLIVISSRSEFKLASANSTTYYLGYVFFSTFFSLTLQRLRKFGEKDSRGSLYYIARIYKYAVHK